MPLNLTAEQRITKSVVIDEAGCWIWQKGKNQYGYGQIRLDKKRWLVHRLTYTLFVGEIPEGMDIDHLCRVRDCCNPSHLEPVDRKTNLVRGEHPNMQAHREGRCARGHVVNADTASPRSDGRLKCRECTNARARERRANAAIARHQ